MNQPRARIIIHIGQHKTGSKALQSFLAQHAQGLLQHGILYPLEPYSRQTGPAYANSHYRLFALLRGEAMLACADSNRAQRFQSQQRKFCHPYTSAQAMFKAIEVERLRCGANTILVSAEDLFDMHTAHESGFCMEWLNSGIGLLAKQVKDFNYEPVIVAYLRRQDHLLAAHYIQYIKGNSSADLDFGSFSTAFEQRLQTWELLQPWETAFGHASMVLRPYEPAAIPLDVISDFFAKILGFPMPPDWTLPLKDREAVNATPNRDYVEFMRKFGRKKNLWPPAFRRKDVLDAALSDSAHYSQSTGTAAWLSPAERRALLARHAEDNRQIAACFLDRPGHNLFAEAIPEDDEHWQAYAGLSPGRTNAIKRNVRQSRNRRRMQAIWHLGTTVALWLRKLFGK